MITFDLPFETTEVNTINDNCRVRNCCPARLEDYQTVLEQLQQFCL